MKPLILVLMWTVWCFLHSALISRRAARFFRRRLGDRYRYYRLWYNGFAMVSIVPVLGFSRIVHGQHNETGSVFFWTGGLLPVWILLWGIVIFLGVQGTRAYDLGVIAGVRQIRESQAENPADTPLSTRGILGVIRHPWYLAGLILIWIRAGHVHWIMILENLVLTAYFFIGMTLEERKLVRAYGESYRAYCRKVSALVPFKWIAGQLKRILN